MGDRIGTVFGGQSMNRKIHRRESLGLGAAVCALHFLQGMSWIRADEVGPGGPETVLSNQRYKVEACDWRVRKRRQLGGMRVEMDCGMGGGGGGSGSLGSTGADMKNDLLKEEVREQFLDTSRKLGVQICSLAMSAFYAQPYAEHPKADEYTVDMIGLMPKLGVKVGFLPLGVRGDL